MSPGLELRVLTGLHREARCSVQDGAVVGADPACDVVLADEGVAPRAGQLRIDDLGWHLHEEGAALPEELPSNAFNHAVPLGSVWITIARQGDPWIDAPVAANDAEESVPPTSKVPAPETPSDTVEADIASGPAATPLETAVQSPPLPTPCTCTYLLPARHHSACWLANGQPTPAR